MKLLQLSQGKFAKVDAEDYERLIAWKWTYSEGYAYRLKTINKKSKKIWLHRFINETPDGKYTDHINGDRLDCRKINLRTCSYAENNRNARTRKDNKSGYRGVYWEKSCKKWRTVISFDGKKNCLGFFNNVLDAAIAYNKKAKELHGDFARLNEIAGFG